MGIERVASGEHRLREHRPLGISVIDFMVLTEDTGAALLVLENSFRAKGGPARHRHLDQDEWFYVVEGEFRFEIGEEAFMLGPGDSALGPRRVPHVWAHGSRQDTDRLRAGRTHGILLPGGHEGGRDAGPGTGSLACPWHGTAGSAAWSVKGDGNRFPRPPPAGA